MLPFVARFFKTCPRQLQSPLHFCGFPAALPVGGQHRPPAITITGSHNRLDKFHIMLDHAKGIIFLFIQAQDSITNMPQQSAIYLGANFIQKYTASTIMVRPSFSSSFFCPPDNCPASSFALASSCRNLITSCAFSASLSSSACTFPARNHALPAGARQTGSPPPFSGYPERLMWKIHALFERYEASRDETAMRGQTRNIHLIQGDCSAIWFIQTCNNIK